MGRLSLLSEEGICLRVPATARPVHIGLSGAPPGECFRNCWASDFSFSELEVRTEGAADPVSLCGQSRLSGWIRHFKWLLLTLSGGSWCKNRKLMLSHFYNDLEYFICFVKHYRKSVFAVVINFSRSVVL